MLPRIEQAFGYPKPSQDVMVMPFVFRLRRPRFDPADFIVLLLHMGGGGPEDYSLPPALQDVDLRKVPKYRVE